MSYEGYKEYLCKKGHYWTQDSVYYCEEIPKCPQCNGEHVWTHSVDETNGMCLDDNGVPWEWCVPYPLEKSSEWDDVWNTDHYGNVYARKIPRYKIPKE